MHPSSDGFDPVTLDTRLNGSAVKVGLSARPHKPGGQFLPALPERVFCRLVRLPRRAWAVYTVLRLRGRLNRSQTVVLTSSFLSRFGLNRMDKSRGLSDLESAGLIRVERRDRRNPAVTLLPLEES
jgi:hypothetical protein